jgi:DNA-directed RNA polymerase subunit RPC12/RpoP
MKGRHSMIYAFKCTLCSLEFDLDLEIPQQTVKCPYCQEKANRVYQVNVKKHTTQNAE